MVNFARVSAFLLPLVNLGLLISQVTAAPAGAESRSAEVTTGFTFSKWVDSIMENPPTALSPEEAVTAYLDTANGTTSTTSTLQVRETAGDEAYCYSEARQRVNVG